jgi:hypothetical protein
VFRQFRRANGIRCDMAVPEGVPGRVLHFPGNSF